MAEWMVALFFMSGDGRWGSIQVMGFVRLYEGAMPQMFMNFTFMNNCIVYLLVLVGWFEYIILEQVRISCYKLKQSNELQFNKLE